VKLLTFSFCFSSLPPSLVSLSIVPTFPSSFVSLSRVPLLPSSFVSLSWVPTFSLSLVSMLRVPLLSISLPLFLVSLSTVPLFSPLTVSFPMASSTLSDLVSFFAMSSFRFFLVSLSTYKYIVYIEKPDNNDKHNKTGFDTSPIVQLIPVEIAQILTQII
jgi:hypothetical protein